MGSGASKQQKKAQTEAVEASPTAPTELIQSNESIAKKVEEEDEREAEEVKERKKKKQPKEKKKQSAEKKTDADVSDGPVMIMSDEEQERAGRYVEENQGGEGEAELSPTSPPLFLSFFPRRRRYSKAHSRSAEASRQCKQRTHGCRTSVVRGAERTGGKKLVAKSSRAHHHPPSLSLTLSFACSFPLFPPHDLIATQATAARDSQPVGTGHLRAAEPGAVQGRPAPWLCCRRLARASSAHASSAHASSAR
jgi:hypothetical protein